MQSISLSLSLRGLTIGLLSIIALGGLVTTSVANAADVDSSKQESLALTPATKRFEVKAGETVANTITVINDGDFKYDFIIYSRPYSVQNEAYEPQFEKTSANTDLYQWMRFEKVSYSINPGERLEIPYEMNVPSGAAPGGHYGVVFVETQPEPASSTSVVRKKRVGSIILANVEGTVTRKGSLISTDVPFWQSSPPLSASSRIENAGNTDFEATVTSSVKDLFGSVKYTESKDYVVYPATIRNVTVKWNNSPWFGLFKYDQTVKILGKTTESSKFILLAPKWLALLMIVTIVAGAWYGLLRKKRQ